MGIAFRCTGCRARLHVSDQRAGGSITCPRCETRVVVPLASPEPSAFESRAVERSLAALDQRQPPAVPKNPGSGARPGRSGVTVPWWAIYAAVMGMVTLAVAAFVGGAWWASITGGR